MGARVFRRRVVHVSDLNNTGHSASSLWIPAIRKVNGNIREIFFYLNRNEGGDEEIEKSKVHPYSLVKLDENAWNYLEREGIITPEFYKGIHRRMEDPESWAKTMLLSERGFKKLAEIYNDPKGRRDAERIMDRGYPDLKDELTGRLKSLER